MKTADVVFAVDVAEQVINLGRVRTLLPEYGLALSFSGRESSVEYHADPSGIENDLKWESQVLTKVVQVFKRGGVTRPSFNEAVDLLRGSPAREVRAFAVSVGATAGA